MGNPVGGNGGIDMQAMQDRADARFAQQQALQEQNEANQHRMLMLQQAREQSNQMFAQERESSADNHKAMMAATQKLNTQG